MYAGRRFIIATIFITENSSPSTKWLPFCIFLPLCQYTVFLWEEIWYLGQNVQVSITNQSNNSAFSLVNSTFSNKAVTPNYTSVLSTLHEASASTMVNCTCWHSYARQGYIQLYILLDPSHSLCYLWQALPDDVWYLQPSLALGTQNCLKWLSDLAMRPPDRAPSNIEWVPSAAEAHSKTDKIFHVFLS